MKLLVFGIIIFVIYFLFFRKREEYINKVNENELVECSNCHTFVPKEECKFINDKCLCKECR